MLFDTQLFSLYLAFTGFDSHNSSLNSFCLIVIQTFPACQKHIKTSERMTGVIL